MPRNQSPPAEKDTALYRQLFFPMRQTSLCSFPSTSVSCQARQNNSFRSSRPQGCFSAMSDASSAKMPASCSHSFQKSRREAYFLHNRPFEKLFSPKISISPLQMRPTVFPAKAKAEQARYAIFRDRTHQLKYAPASYCLASYSTAHLL